MWWTHQVHLRGRRTGRADNLSEASIQFFKVVQNKLHYAAHGHTAAEVIYERADAQKPFADYVAQPDAIPSSGGRTVLTDAGSTSHAQALEKAKEGRCSMCYYL